MALPLVRRALELLPDVGFVNAYGLTETSSTIAVLGPDDHRAALASDDDAVARRLGSVGQIVPGIEVQIRADDGSVLGPGETGELFVRGDQVSGRYTDIGSVLDDDGWFPTKDVASLDADGYLFIGGRSDDTIIRGGENIAPAEIEDVLVEHPTYATSPWSDPRIRSGGRSSSRWWCPLPTRRPIRTICAPTCAGSCAVPARPTGWCSAPSCPPTPPARCCAAN